MADIPRGPVDAQLDDPNEDEDLISPDERRPQRLLDSRRQADGELSDSDDEGEDDRRDHTSHRDKEAVGPTTGRRFGAAVGIMTTGSTHGLGPTAAMPVSSAPAVSSTVTPMDVDDDQTVPAQSTQSPPKAKEAAPVVDAGSDAMAVDPPAPPAAS